ncbi:MAG: hypothetical protein HQ551_04430 [Desulfobacteraceae bacterium]|nr:hypothetical protein [Desulfobacteraceae bacterium]
MSSIKVKKKIFHKISTVFPDRPDEQTPWQVLSHIITHEMIHLLIPREEIDGHVVYHSEAFWQKERDRPGTVTVLVVDRDQFLWMHPLL